MGDNKLTMKEHSPIDPMSVLMAQFTGKPIPKPRKSIPYNLWAKTNHHIIDKEFKVRCVRERPSKHQRLTLLSKVTRELFDKLSQEEKNKWQDEVNKEHEVALPEWSNGLASPASTAPSDRQRCIERLVTFAQPILDIICECTGMKASLFVGGPEPADGGRLNIISMHSGTKAGFVQTNFGKAERSAIKESIIPIFGQFLKKCYTVEECRSRALPDHGRSTISLLAAEDQSVTFHSVNEDNDSITSTSTPSPALNISAQAGPVSHHPSLTVSLAPSCARTPDPGSFLASCPRASTPDQRPCLPASHALSPDLSPQVLPAPPARLAAHVSYVPATTLSEPPAPRAPTPPLSASRENTSHATNTTQGQSNPAPDSPSARLFPPSLHPSPPTIAYLPDVTSTPQDSVASRSPMSSPLPFGSSHSTPASPSVQPSSSPQNSPNSPHTSLPTSVEQPQSLGKRKGANIEVDCPSNTKRLNKGEGAVKTPVDARSSTQELSNWRSVDCKGYALPDISPGAPLIVSSSLPPIPISTESSPTSTGPFKLSADAPAWILSASEMLRSQQLFGERWMSLVTCWEKFEAKEKFVGKERLRNRNRPACISHWIRCARSTTYRPSINLDTFEREFSAWWMSLQPEWRVPGDGGLMMNAAGGWEPIRRAGVNGLLSVVTALFFWRCALTPEDPCQRWESALEDVHHVLESLLRDE